LNKVVSIDVIERAFEEVLYAIDQIEQTVKSQTDIEVNEMKIAQLEKIVYVNSYLSEVEALSGVKSYLSPLKVAVSR
jgi:microcompartment protein CcmL/EutN